MIDGRTGGAEGPIKAATMLQDAKAQVRARAHGAKAADIPTENAPAEAQGQSEAADIPTANDPAAHP